MKRIVSLFLMLFCLGILKVSAQKFVLDSLITASQSNRSKIFSEKIFIHTDRTSYLTGETLWFKAYRTEASSHQRIDWSKILYVELYDKNNVAVIQAKVPLTKNGAEGALFVPATLSSGNYVLRAYTNWMKNFGEDFFFHQPISIINPFVAFEMRTDSVNNQVRYDAQFLPEGGELVTGLESVVGVRVVNKYGKGISYRGAVLDSRNDTVARFRSSNFGLSKFRFIPQPDQQYHIVIIDRLRKTMRYPMPSIKSAGYVMHVHDSLPDRIFIRVSSSQRDSEVLVLLGHTRQTLKVHQQSAMVNGIATFEVDKNLLDPGVSVFTVFNSRLKPVGERLYFVQPREKLRVDITGNPYLVGARAEVKLGVLIGDKKSSASGIFSMSVYKADSLDLPAATIAEYLLLTSDLSGEVENPGYYFGPETPGLRNDLDNLMLTHGWRKFNWNNRGGDQSQRPFLPEIGGHLIFGNITERGSGKPVDRSSVYLSFMGSPVNLYVSNSQNGRFLFETEPLTGTRSMIVQPEQITNADCKIEIEESFFDQFGLAAPSFHLNDKQVRAIEQRSIHMQVQNLFYQATVDLEPKYPFKSFYGTPDETYNLDDYTRFPTLEEVMREYVPGVRVKRLKDGFHLSNIDMINKSVFSTDPLTLVDGVPIFDINKLMEIDPLKLKQLDVLKRRYYLNAMAYDGIVSFTSYKGDLAGYRPPERALLLNYKGLESVRQFFSPRYEANTSDRNTLPDARHVLFWTTGRFAGELQPLTFFTSDVVGEYKVVLQALTDDGSPGYYSTTFVVK